MTQLASPQAEARRQEAARQERERQRHQDAREKEKSLEMIKQQVGGLGVALGWLGMQLVGCGRRAAVVHLRQMTVTCVCRRPACQVQLSVSGTTGFHRTRQPSPTHE
jgi:hypothetical protein